MSPSVYFKGKNPFEIHDFLSLINKRSNCTRFFMVSKRSNNSIEDNKNLKHNMEYYVWTVAYFGTVRDFVFTNYGRI